jgi:hypothetical protein
LAFPHRLELQAGYLDVHKEVDLVGSRALAFRDGGTLVGSLPFSASHAEICRAPWRGFSLPHPTWMARAQWFRRYRYRIPEALRAEDQDLLLRAYPMSRFACLPEPLLAYRVGATSVRDVLRARMSLGIAMLTEHSRARRYGQAAFGCLVAGLKALADVAFAAVGSGSPTARAVRADLPAGSRAAWQELWALTETCVARIRGATAAR